MYDPNGSPAPLRGPGSYGSQHGFAQPSSSQHGFAPPAASSGGENIQVVVRVRPLSQEERSRGDQVLCGLACSSAVGPGLRG